MPKTPQKQKARDEKNDDLRHEFVLNLASGDKIQIKQGTERSKDDIQIKLDCEWRVQGLEIARDILKQNTVPCRDMGLAAAVCTINAMIDAYWDEVDYGQ